MGVHGTLGGEVVDVDVDEDGWSIVGVHWRSCDIPVERVGVVDIFGWIGRDEVGLAVDLAGLMVGVD
jgi:hypothetical protein